MPVFSEAPHYEDRRIRGVAADILGLVTRWRSVVTFVA